MPRAPPWARSGVWNWLLTTCGHGRAWFNANARYDTLSLYPLGNSTYYGNGWVIDDVQNPNGLQSYETKPFGDVKRLWMDKWTLAITDMYTRNAAVPAAGGSPAMMLLGALLAAVLGLHLIL